MECIFCKIVAGELPSDILYQDEELIAFRDINPHAPVHLLIIPKRHIPSVAGLTESELPIIGRMVAAANRLAKDEGVLESGYRLVINCGENGRQIVQHLHMHLIGGRKLSESLG